MKLKNLLIYLLVLLFVSISAVPSAAGGAEFNLKYSHGQPKGQISDISARWMADELKKRSNGRIEMKVFPGYVLGRGPEVLASMEAGDVDFAWESSANLGPSIREFNVFSLSYLFKDFNHYKKVFSKNAYVMKRINQFVEKSPYGITLVGMLGGISRQLYNSVRLVNTPEDLKGIKLRVQASPVEAKVWSTLGAVPVQLTWTEIYTALQTGVVHGAESSMDAYFRNKFYEQASYFAFTNHQFLVMPLIMSKKTYEKLPQDLRTMVLELAYKSGEFCQKLYRESEGKLVKQAPDKGIKISYPDVSLFQAKVAGIRETEAAKYKTQDILKAIKEAGQ